MEYQAFSTYRLNKVIRKSDFQNVSMADQDIVKPT